LINFNSSFLFRVKKSNYCMNLTFGVFLKGHGPFKNTVWAQRCRDWSRWTVPCHTVPISHGNTAITEKEKNSLTLLQDLYFYSPDFTCILRILALRFVLFCFWNISVFKAVRNVSFLLHKTVINSHSSWISKATSKLRIFVRRQSGEPRFSGHALVNIRLMTATLTIH
jgi:hypothetical protein